MSDYHERHRGQGAGRQGAGQGERAARQRRTPLFPLEADDIAPSARRTPPAPLGDLFSDLDAAMPVRSVASRRNDEPRERAAQPTSGAAHPVARSEQSAARSTAQSAPARAAARAEATYPVLTREAARPSQPELLSPRLESFLEAPVAAIDAARERYESIEGDLARLELSEARSRLGIGYVPPAAPTLLGLNNVFVLGAICIVSLLVLFSLGGRGAATGMSSWNPLQRAGAAATTSLAAVVHDAAIGNYALKAPPSISAQQIDRILEAYGSPATGTGQEWYNLGMKYGIDPAFAVAFFIHESSAGSNPNWAGIKPGGGTTHNVGNIICAGYATCYGRFRDYPSWSAGIEDWYRLIDVEYIQGRGHQTVADVIPVYAPAFENDVQGYVNAVHGLIDQWRSGGVR